MILNYDMLTIPDKDQPRARVGRRQAKCFTADASGDIINGAMTNTMKVLIEELSRVPEDQQDEVATPLLKELQELRKTSARPLTEVIGAGTGLYESPEQVDEEIRNQREEWDY